MSADTTIEIAVGDTGLSLRMLIKAVGANNWWNFDTDTLEAYDAGDITDYGIAMTEDALGVYRAEMPAALPAGVYTVQVREGAGTVNDDLVASVEVGWDGSLLARISGVPAALLDQSNAVETGLTVRGALRAALAVLAGKASGAGTGTNTFRAAASDSKVRVTSTVDSAGNRSSVTLDTTP